MEGFRQNRRLRDSFRTFIYGFTVLLDFMAKQCDEQEGLDDIKYNS